MPKTIWVSLGKKDYVGGVVSATDDNDEPANISDATFVIGLSRSRHTPPAADKYLPPSINVQGATTADRRVKLLLDEATATTLDLDLTKTYFAYVNIADNPTIEAVLIDDPISPR